MEKELYGEINVKPIGVVHSPRLEPEDDYWGNMVSTIEIDADQFSDEVLWGLEDFSHIEVVFFMNRVDPAQINTKARRPRNNPEWPLVGIFAQRPKARPNRIGVSRCRVLKVEGHTITVEGLDAIDGTPVVDIKPYIAEFGPRGEVRQPEWATELMANYYKNGEDL